MTGSRTCACTIGGGQCRNNCDDFGYCQACMNDRHAHAPQGSSFSC